ncbi:hypothetical protein IQ247_05970 [Plectonema cf. radiosum LEGE 06105]|uniref:Uncharacterized protein n=1 Tax=Plectonema cf. radiosum LEGE 06105 TaxID=945769 RepID=A0A8J7F4G1_9CYAN|nr:hypothetical protein [Plectonema radiosum]MBE9212259.1 hypothetical protein [Plectonema cf. radiosum LEGE 06105]
MVDHPIKGNSHTPEEIESMNRTLSRQRSQEVKSAIGIGSNQWSSYPQQKLTSPRNLEEKTK